MNDPDLSVQVAPFSLGILLGHLTEMGKPVDHLVSSVHGYGNRTQRTVGGFRLLVVIQAPFTCVRPSNVQSHALLCLRQQFWARRLIGQYGSASHTKDALCKPTMRAAFDVREGGSPCSVEQVLLACEVDRVIRHRLLV